MSEEKRFGRLPSGSHINWYMATSQKAFLAAFFPHMKRLPRRVKEAPCTRRYLGSTL